jgi:hypothetical protein
MSSPTPTNQALPPIDPRMGLLLTVADHLIPLFNIGAIDAPLARRMALSAVYAYDPETPADFINVGRTIAFSMAALGLLGKAASADMTFPQQMRAFGRANALNRSADQSERTMMLRRRRQQASLLAEQPDEGSASSAPDTQTSDAEVQDAMAGIMEEYLAACPPPATDPEAPELTPEPAPVAAKTAPIAAKSATPQPPRAVSPIHPAATAPASAIHHGAPWSDAGQPRPVSLKEGLLRHTALQTVLDHGAARYLG